MEEEIMRIGSLSCRISALILVMAMLCAITTFAFATEETDIPDTFYAPTILQMIESNLATGNPDEEFFRAIANAYLADPVLFCEIITDFAEE
jgi:uncharacterized membrane protein